MLNTAQIKIKITNINFITGNELTTHSDLALSVAAKNKLNMFINAP